MYISGSGIVTPIEIKVIDYEVDIDYSWNWFKMSDGSYKASDRGEAYDHTTTTISIHGKEDYIDGILSGVLTNQLDTGVMELTSINAPIFGNHVDYDGTTISGSLKEINLKEQTSLNGYGLNLKFIADTLTYNSYTLELPEFNALEIGYTGDEEQTFSLYESYANGDNSGEINIARSNKDRGIFTGVFKFNNADLGKLLNFQKVNRTSAFDMPNICGVEYPFSKLSGNSGLRAKLYEVSDITYISPDFYSAKVTFVQDFS